MPRKALQLATRMAIASKIEDDQITLIDKLEFAEPKTKEMVGVIKHLGCQGESLLIATAAHAPNVYKSARNIQKVAVQSASDLNALSVLSARRLVITTEALDQIKQRAAANGSKAKSDGAEA